MASVEKTISGNLPLKDDVVVDVAATTVINSESTQEEVPTAKAVFDFINRKDIVTQMTANRTLAQNNATEIAKLKDIVARISGGRVSVTSVKLPLFTMVMMDHFTNDKSWVWAKSTGEWISGNEYPEAYQHLVDDMSGRSEQEDSITIPNGTGQVSYKIHCWRANDGHRIVQVAHKNEVDILYTNTLAAWYYVIDTANKRFMLPRSSAMFQAAADYSVGHYRAESLPAHSHSASVKTGENVGAWASVPYLVAAGAGNVGGIVVSEGKHVNTLTVSVGNTSDHNHEVYGAPQKVHQGSRVQPIATDIFLYFYCGVPASVQEKTPMDSDMGNAEQSVKDWITGIDANLEDEPTLTVTDGSVTDVDGVAVMRIEPPEGEGPFWARLSCGKIQIGPIEIPSASTVGDAINGDDYRLAIPVAKNTTVHYQVSEGVMVRGVEIYQKKGLA